MQLRILSVLMLLIKHSGNGIRQIQIIKSRSQLLNISVLMEQIFLHLLYWKMTTLWLIEFHKMLLVNGNSPTIQKDGQAISTAWLGWHDASILIQLIRQIDILGFLCVMVMTAISLQNLYAIVMNRISLSFCFFHTLPTWFNPWMSEFSVLSKQQWDPVSILSFELEFFICRSQNGFRATSRWGKKQ